VDVFGPFPVQKDTAFLLCSDGLYKTLKDRDIRAIFARSGGPKGATQTLVAAAYERGSDDNISVVIAEFGQVPREQAQGTMPLEFEPPASEEPSPAPDDAGGDEPSTPEGGKGSWWQRWRK